jgi:hypothetical protein
MIQVKDFPPLLKEIKEEIEAVPNAIIAALQHTNKVNIMKLHAIPG